MEQILINIIANAIPHTIVRCFETTGGWVVEAVNPNFANEATAEQQILNALQNGVPAGMQPLILWKVFAYSNEIEKFTVSGTLHTRAADYDDNGIQTTYLEANDCYVNISEFDGEILQLGDYNGLRIEVIEAMTDDNQQPLLPYQANAHHHWLETLGGQYGLDNNRRVEVIGAAAHPIRLAIHLLAHEPNSGRQ